MKGMELSREYFEIYGMPMLKEQFPEQLPFIAAGLFGSGSECFGYDDQVSRDHDFEPGFCLMLPGEDVIDRKTAFQMERAYAKLPSEFRGYKRNSISPVGGSRHGVIRTADFLMDKTGTEDGELTAEQWMRVPEYSLAEAVNGSIFFDGPRWLSAVREKLRFYPSDIMKKKLAGNLLLMAQSGQYNYMRCVSRAEGAAAQLAVFEFVKSTIEVIFLLNRKYQPYYKWSFRALRGLPKLALLAELLEYLMTTDNEESMTQEKYTVIESIAADITDELMQQNLTRAICTDLEKHAYSVNDMIADPQLRNLHILAAV